MTEVTRKLASVQKITSLDPIEGADKIECAGVLGWHVVVPKGRYNVGDLVVYLEVDSVIPVDVLIAEGLWDNDKRKGKLAGAKGDRLKTVRLRKQVSQGLIMNLEVLKICWDYADISQHVEEGQDVSEALGVTKYEPPVAANMVGIVKGNFPSFLKKTDTNRIQGNPAVFDELADIEVYITLKMDGTSFTAFHRIDTVDSIGNEFGVCSRNLQLKEQVPGQNVYWDMVAKYNLKELLPNWRAFSLGIQAEAFGPCIQKNRMGADEVQLGLFDIFNIDECRYLDYDEMIRVACTLMLPTVPLVYRGPFTWKTVNELVAFADEQKYANGAQAEGIVIRPVIEQRSEALDGRLAVKVISPKYLLKHGE